MPEENVTELVDLERYLLLKVIIYIENTFYIQKHIRKVLIIKQKVMIMIPDTIIKL